MAPPRLVVAALLAAATLLLARLPAAAAKVHSLTVKGDRRFAFSVESFGFLPGGTFSLRVHGVTAAPADAAHRMGFVLYPTTTESRINAQVSTLVVNGLCALDADNDGLVKLNVSDPAAWVGGAPAVEVTVERAGLYDLLFTHCAPTAAGTTVGFTADVAFANPGGHFLPAGELPLPAAYGAFAAAFLAALLVWLRYTRAHAAQAHKLHHLMSALCGLKALSLGCEALMYHYVDTTGHSTGWNVAYYVTSAARGLLTVAIIALLGAGWSLVRPFLNTREKHVLMVALPLQVVTNVATIVVDEMAPGSTAYGMWCVRGARGCGAGSVASAPVRVRACAAMHAQAHRTIPAPTPAPLQVQRAQARGLPVHRLRAGARLVQHPDAAAAAAGRHGKRGEQRRGRRRRRRRQDALHALTPAAVPRLLHDHDRLHLREPRACVHHVRDAAVRPHVAGGFAWGGGGGAHPFSLPPPAIGAAVPARAPTHPGHPRPLPLTPCALRPRAALAVARVRRARHAAVFRVHGLALPPGARERRLLLCAQREWRGRGVWAITRASWGGQLQLPAPG